jgi:hypothetical protein
MPSEDRERDWQLGKVHRKVDAMERMRGIARYTDDLKLPGMLHAKILRSPHAHARIKGIDLAPALALPGVFAAVTGQDFKIPYGVIPWTPDENALAVDKVCHVGDGVVAIAAVDEDTANAACKAVVVDYEPLRAFFDPEQALAVRDREGTINPYSRKGNVSKHVLLEFGEVDAELASSDLVIEGEYFFGGTTHGAIEPHCAVAQVEPNGILTVWSATQVSHYLHRELAKVLGLPPHQDPRDPAAARRGLRRQERALRPRVLRGQAGDEDGAAGQAAVHPRGGVLRPPRSPPDEDEVPHGLHAGRQDQGGRREDDPRRRGLLELRPGDDVLLGAAFVRAVCVRDLSLRQHARVHQQAGVRAQARARLGAAALRDGDPARQGGGGAGHRSDRAAPAQRPRRGHPDDQ